MKYTLIASTVLILLASCSDGLPAATMQKATTYCHAHGMKASTTSITEFATDRKVVVGVCCIDEAGVSYSIPYEVIKP